MVSFSSSEDVRMQQIRGKITGLEGDLEHLFGYVDSLPGAEQREARAALRRAFEMGRSISDLDRVPATPPIGENEVPLLGPALRHHVMQMRQVYGDIDDVRQMIESMFGDVSLNHFHSMLRKEGKNNTDTASTEFDVAV